MSKPDLRTRFEELISRIDEAHDRVLSDHLINLNDLEKTVTTLCKDLEKADPQSTKDIQPLMAQMITKLDTLAQSLQEYQARKASESAE